MNQQNWMKVAMSRVCAQARAGISWNVLTGRMTIKWQQEDHIWTSGSVTQTSLLAYSTDIADT